MNITSHIFVNTLTLSQSIRKHKRSLTHTNPFSNMNYIPFPEPSIDVPSLCCVRSAAWESQGAAAALLQTLCAHRLKSLTWMDNWMTRRWTDIRGEATCTVHLWEKAHEEDCSGWKILQFVNILIACVNPHLFPKCLSATAARGAQLIGNRRAQTHTHPLITQTNGL